MVSNNVVLVGEDFGLVWEDVRLVVEAVSDFGLVWEGGEIFGEDVWLRLWRIKVFFV